MQPSIRSWLQDNYFSVAQPVQKNDAGDEPLILAGRQGRCDIILYLLELNAPLDVLDEYGNNALWAACYSEDHDTIVALIHAGIDIDYQNAASGATALIYAASSGKEKVVRQLLEAGADKTLMTHDDFTALDLASTRNILKLIQAC